MSTEKRAKVCERCRKIVLKQCVQFSTCRYMHETRQHDVVKHTRSVWFPGRPLLGDKE